MKNLHQLVVTLLLLSLMTKPASMGRKKCPRIDIENGRVKPRSNGRIAKFKCNKGFIMIEGDQFTTCTNGKWNGKVPKCIGPSCRTLLHVEHSAAPVYYFKNSLVQFSCLPGYVLEGSPALSCNGHAWNASTPACVAPEISAEPSCDFEDRQCCGWVVESGGDSDVISWSQKSAFDATYPLGLGPRVDHTLDRHLGKYMFVDVPSSARPGVKTRMFSPVYQPPMNALDCFIFYYYTYGHETGGFSTYIKPQNASLDGLIPDLLIKSYHGDHWQLGYIQLPELEEPFQVVMEVIHGGQQASKVAVDDVSLVEGDACLPYLQLISSSSPLDADTQYLFTTQGAESGDERNVECDTEDQQCEGRNTGGPHASPTNGSIEGVVNITTCQGRCRELGYVGVCGCDAHCSKVNNCCSDFSDTCLDRKGVTVTYFV